MHVFDPRAYWEKRLENSTGLEGVGYVGMGQPFNEWMYRVRRSVFKRFMRRHLGVGNPGKVLDVGSGTGVYLRLWKELGATSITGTDLTATAVERLQKELPDVDLFRMDITDGDARLDGTYDQVSCMDVLFHVVDEKRFESALHNFHKALKPGGMLVISDNFLHREERSETHFVIRGLADYERSLAATGFHIIERRPMFHLLNRPMDSGAPLLWRWGGLVERICTRSKSLGGLLAAVVYPLELLLVRVRREGASTEIMVCRRP